MRACEQLAHTRCHTMTRYENELSPGFHRKYLVPRSSPDPKVLVFLAFLLVGEQAVSSRNS